MRIDFRSDPALAERYSVVDTFLDGEELEHVAWADEEKGEAGLYVMRARQLSDRPNADLKVRDSGGQPKIRVHIGGIEIVDLHASPFKDDMLKLLQDPDVRAAFVAMFIEAIQQGLTATKGDNGHR